MQNPNLIIALVRGRPQAGRLGGEGLDVGQVVDEEGGSLRVPKGGLSVEPCCITTNQCLPLANKVGFADAESRDFVASCSVRLFSASPFPA